MPLYELFCMAKPALARTQASQLLRSAASAVLSKGGVLTDIKSYGERELAYEIRRPGMKLNEVCSCYCAHRPSRWLHARVALPYHGRFLVHLSFQLCNL